MAWKKVEEGQECSSIKNILALSWVSLEKAQKRSHRRLVNFLPSYSLELKPIEHFGYWLKRAVTETLAYSATLILAIFSALQRWHDRIQIV